MASDNVQHFTDDNFDSEVLEADQPVLVDFWAEWCGPCKMIAPVIDELADEFAGKAKVGKMDTDSNQAAARKFGISAIPSILIFKDGELRKKLVGLQQKSALRDALNEVMAD